MRLPHFSPDCTGGWHTEQRGNFHGWRCDGCGALAYSSDELSRAVFREHLFGRYLLDLTRAGQKLLDANGPTW